MNARGYPAEVLIVDDPVRPIEPEPAEFDREAWMAHYAEFLRVMDEARRQWRAPRMWFAAEREIPLALGAGRTVTIRTEHPATALLRGHRHEARPTDVVLPRAEAERRLAEFARRWAP